MVGGGAIVRSVSRRFLSLVRVKRFLSGWQVQKNARYDAIAHLRLPDQPVADGVRQAVRG
jgi:hypothetical protein